MKVVSLENLSKYNELLNQKTVRSVNSVKPDSNGNVTLGTEKSTFNKVVYDTGYFSISASKTYSFDLTGTDLENVSKENVNIRLVAKVTTAHSGYEVGDIAQLTTAIDHSAGNGGGEKVDVCAYIRGNTLYLYSGNNPYLSIFKGDHWLEKANVQIKAVLTAFVPDDGSILLIAEDQTNTSKLIGLPDGTLTWGDKNISLLSPVHYSRSSNFETSGRTSIKLPSYLSLMVNGHYFRNDTEVTVDISDTANWDSTETDYTVAENRAGKDFYIYAVDDNKVAKSVHIVLSANSTVPVGYTADNSRKIAGFHCLCLGVGTIANHPASGYLTGDIIPNSVWDLSFKSKNIYGNEGQVYVDCQDLWVAIYLPSWDGSKIVSKFGGIIIDGTSSTAMDGEQFAEFAGLVGGRLPSRDEFKVFAFGSNQKTAIKGTADPNTTGGHVDTNNRRMISDYFIEDCCGAMWQWSSDCYEAMSTLWSSPNTYMNSYSWQTVPTYSTIGDVNHRQLGSCLGLLRRALLGGNWGNSSSCGSRCVDCSHFGSHVHDSFSARLVFGTKTELV